MFGASAEQRLLGKYLCDNFAVDIGQAEVTALEAIGELLMVDPQTVEDGGVQVMDVNRILDHVVTEVIGLTVGEARLDPAAS